MKIEEDTITFSSGRTAYANNGIVGLCPGASQIHEGYDGALEPLHPDDLRELAECMIAAWTQVRDHGLPAESEE